MIIVLILTVVWYIIIILFINNLTVFFSDMLGRWNGWIFWIKIDKLCVMADSSSEHLTKIRGCCRFHGLRPRKLYTSMVVTPNSCPGTYPTAACSEFDVDCRLGQELPPYPHTIIILTNNLTSHFLLRHAWPMKWLNIWNKNWQTLWYDELKFRTHDNNISSSKSCPVRVIYIYIYIYIYIHEFEN